MLNERISDELIAKVNPTDRIIMTKNKGIDFYDVKQDSVGRPIHPYKPTGLWYAIGNSWIRWVRQEIPKWEGDYLFKIEINEPKILVIRNADDKKTLEEKYGMRGDTYPIAIDWNKVSKRYAGVELHHISGKFSDWTNSWDVESGCIWNKDGVKKIIKMS